ncbi:zinc finger, C6HC-type protein [Pseudohyphozyma bogoriensis]|nr:zinc finger, C6HC-type protein [Pseudohyphozyma bogoriensis]
MDHPQQHHPPGINSGERALADSVHPPHQFIVTARELVGQDAPLQAIHDAWAAAASPEYTYDQRVQVAIHFLLEPPAPQPGAHDLPAQAQAAPVAQFGQHLVHGFDPGLAQQQAELQRQYALVQHQQQSEHQRILQAFAQVDQEAFQREQVLAQHQAAQAQQQHATPPRPHPQDDPRMTAAKVASGSGAGSAKAEAKAKMTIDLSLSSDDDEPGNVRALGKQASVIQLDSDTEDEDVRIGKQNGSGGKGKGKAEAIEIVGQPLNGANGSPASPAGLPRSEEDDLLASVLLLIPDVAPAHALTLIQQELPGPQRVERVLESLWGDPEYPKVSSVGKGKKREREDDDVVKVEVEKDWTKAEGREKLGMAYQEASLDELYDRFNIVNKNIIRKEFHERGFFGPTFVFLEEEMTKPDKERSFKLLGTARVNKGKGKQVLCRDLEVEKEGLFTQLRVAKEKKQAIEDEIARGEVVECACCFDDKVPFSQHVACNGEEMHFFCKECAVAQVDTIVGQRKHVLACMSVDGCTGVFPDFDLPNFLPETTISLLHRIRQEKEVGLAELEGLASCPFCPYAYVIENEDERLFVCQREDCMKISCRSCKKENHLPKTCDEVDLDKKIDGLHKVEEAMSAALIRKCPKCSATYLKEDGCNKITCPDCRTVSCHVCGKIVSGYAHFANAGSNAPNGSEPGATCPLWDDFASRQFKEIEQAKAAAVAELAKANPAVQQEDLEALKLDKPTPTRPGQRRVALPVPAQPRDDPAQLALDAARMVQVRAQIAVERRERQQAAQEAHVARIRAERARRAEQDDAKAAKRERLRKR